MGASVDPVVAGFGGAVVVDVARAMVVDVVGTVVVLVAVDVWGAVVSIRGTATVVVEGEVVAGRLVGGSEVGGTRLDVVTPSCDRLACGLIVPATVVEVVVGGP